MTWQARKQHNQTRSRHKEKTRTPTDKKPKL
uniref:Uncharacterized protein n=1 Tax=Rhizophora mucronata TaxID=61149 RepID=A0A2P2PHL9_RHIMU